MNIQAILNEDLFKKLPIIKNILKNSSFFEKNQIISLVLREANNSATSIDDMTTAQIDKFQNDLISTFNFNKWV